VSLKPVEKFAAGVMNTGGKFATGINETSGTSGKFTVVDTGSVTVSFLGNIFANLP
jgi:hypothetical protein